MSSVTTGSLTLLARYGICHRKRLTNRNNNPIKGVKRSVVEGESDDDLTLMTHVVNVQQMIEVVQSFQATKGKNNNAFSDVNNV
jgi:hypothetical protein